jgi:hypothetical protein
VHLWFSRPSSPSFHKEVSVRRVWMAGPRDVAPAIPGILPRRSDIFAYHFHDVGSASVKKCSSGIQSHAYRRF